MAENNASSRRRTSLACVGGLYKKKFRWINICVYCGSPAQCRDHVLPLSVAVSLDFDHPRIRNNTGQGLNTVPSCNQCNLIAAGNAFFSIRQKRQFIQKRLKVKLRKWLRHIIWDEEEIAELGPSMRDQVEQAMRNRIAAEIRVTWPTHK